MLFVLIALDAGAQSLPPAVAACAEETDVLKRLSCFDREVAPYLSHPAQAAPAAQATSPAGTASATAAPPHPASPPAAPVDTTRHIQARIVGIETYPDGIVVHLDNGQVWREVEDTPVDLRLRAGDTVTIERLMGSYWISGHNGTAAKVRLKN